MAGYLDIPDQLLCRCFDGNFAVYGSLYGIRPPHGFIQHFGIKTVRVFAPVHDYVPVPWVKKAERNVHSL